MGTRFDGRWKGNSGIGCAFIPFTAIDTIFHRTCYLLTCRIATLERHLGQLVLAHLVRNVTGQSGSLITQWQCECAAVGLATQIRHVSLYHEMIEHGLLTQVLRQQHRHLNGKGTVVCRHRLAFLQNLALYAAAQVAGIPIARIGHPPESHLATDGIFHLRTLHRNACIGQRLALGLHGVTRLVRLLIVGKLHLERRTLVLLDADTDALVVGTEGEPSVQQSCRQGELGGTLAIAVGSHLLLTHQLIVGIAQLYVDGLLSYGNIIRYRLLFPHDGCHMHRLSRTVDATVRKQAGMLCLIVVFIVVITTIHTEWRTIAVRGGIGKHLIPITVLLLDDGIGQGFSRPGIHSHIAHLVVRHGLRQEPDTRNEIELA